MEVWKFRGLVSLWPHPSSLGTSQTCLRVQGQLEAWKFGGLEVWLSLYSAFYLSPVRAFCSPFSGRESALPLPGRGAAPHTYQSANQLISQSAAPQRGAYPNKLSKPWSKLLKASIKTPTSGYSISFLLSGCMAGCDVNSSPRSRGLTHAHTRSPTFAIRPIAISRTWSGHPHVRLSKAGGRAPPPRPPGPLKPRRCGSSAHP